MTDPRERGASPAGGPGSGARRPSRLLLPLWWLNGLAVIGVLLSQLSPHVSPVTFWPLAFFGIAWPVLMLLNGVFILIWLILRRKRVWPSVIAMALGAGHLGEYIGLPFRGGPPGTTTSPIKVMSWNTRIFDLYNWSHNVNTKDEMLDLIRMEDADVLCLQEFVDNDARWGRSVKDELLRDMRFTRVADAYTSHTKHGYHFGIATFSTMPIIAQGAIHFPDDLNNLCLWSDIALKNDTVRVYNAHLASLRFTEAEYDFVKEVQDGTSTEEFEHGGKRLAQRLKNGFLRRASQVDRITAHMRTCPYPIIWCGDMNDTPMSWSYQQLRSVGLEDAFTESDSGTGNTYLGIFPGVRIDHIMHGPRLRSWGSRTLPDELSDHRAIVCRMDVIKAGEE